MMVGLGWCLSQSLRVGSDCDDDDDDDDYDDGEGGEMGDGSQGVSINKQHVAYSALSLGCFPG